MTPAGLLSVTRFLLHAWIILWTTTIPLFHTHRPDPTDAWSLLHSGGAHTIVSPDLPGEFSHPSYCVEYNCSRHVSQRTINSPEIGLAVIIEEIDDRKASSLLGISSCLALLNQTALVTPLIELENSVNQPRISPSQSAPRAPPFHTSITV